VVPSRFCLVTGGGHALNTAKLAFLIFNEFLVPQVMEFLSVSNIDYHLRIGLTPTGRDAGRNPHLGRGRYPSLNAVLVITFEDEAPLQPLVEQIARFNAAAVRTGDRVHLFQVPLEVTV